MYRPPFRYCLLAALCMTVGSAEEIKSEAWMKMQAQGAENPTARGNALERPIRIREAPSEAPRQRLLPISLVRFLNSDAFRLEVGPAGITGLRKTQDLYDTNYLAPKQALGRLIIRDRKEGEPAWTPFDWSPKAETEGSRLALSAADANGLAARETFSLAADRLTWTITLANTSNEGLEVGDLGVDLPLNNRYGNSPTDNYTKSLIRHSFVGEEGSFIFWMRTNAIPPFLLMLPGKDTHLEYFEARPGRGYNTFLLSKASGEDLKAKGGTWRLPQTSLLLKPGESKSYSFQFLWANGYEGVRDLLYREGQIDTHIEPGMTVPTDLSTMIALRTQARIESVTPEYPAQTRVASRGERSKNTHLYQIHFSRLGENIVWVKYGGGRRLPLQFFVTEPIETLIKKRTQFLVTHEQVKDPSKWYFGLYSQWDMKHQKLRSPEDLDGLPAYSVACDDPALGKAPFLATKNVYYPDQTEIDSIELYLRKYVWGGLQQTTEEPYPYSIYGIDNWKKNRASPLDTDKGKKHIWRIYDYPHVIALYYNMYLVAKDHPGMVHYLDQEGYLQRAWGTAMAYFTVPMEIVKWSAYETGTYNEIVIPALIQALEENHRGGPASALRAHWEAKAAYFINRHPYLYGSEYSFDSTAFEATQALAKYALNRLDSPAAADFRNVVKKPDATAFLEEQMRLNLACRGWLEPEYYCMGSDFRGSGSASYTLTYMSQMGGSGVLDYGLNFARDPAPYLGLGYASYLSSWALLNSGDKDSGYGYWYPGAENDGGAGGGFEARPWGTAWLGRKEMGRGSWWYSGEIDLGFTGALRSAATIVTDDPVFGVIAYGGDLERAGNTIRVVPKDGLRARFHIMRGAQKVHFEFLSDGFARGQAIVVDDSLRRIAFSAESRSPGAHPCILKISGLPSGAYEVKVGDTVAARFHGPEAEVTIPLEAGSNAVTMRRM